MVALNKSVRHPYFVIMTLLNDMKAVRIKNCEQIFNKFLKTNFTDDFSSRERIFAPSKMMSE